MTQLPPQVPMIPLVVPPAPLPTVIEVGHSAALKIVQLKMSTPAGIAFYFIDCDAAAKIGADIQQSASMARAGLTIPPPNGHRPR